MDCNRQQASPQSRRPNSNGSFLSILVVFFSFIAIFSLALISSQSNTKNTFSILHAVPEGHVGVYWRGGAILNTTTNPGFHLKIPLFTQYLPVQVTHRTHQVSDISCGTKWVMINFQTIEVVSRLKKEYVFDTLVKYGVNYESMWIYDKIRHEINRLCTSCTLQQVYMDDFDQIDEKMKDALQGDCTLNAPGIEIISVRVTKPTIPSSIRKKFEDLKVERTKVLIAEERQKVVEKEAEIQIRMAISEAEKYANVNKILMEQNLIEKESYRRQLEIDNQINLACEKANASDYRVLKEAEANELKFTPELKFIEAIVNVTEVFFGDKVPKVVLRLIGKSLHQILEEAFGGENFEV